jgi:hypothetical protein
MGVRTKVVWTDAEKSVIVKRAFEIQRDDPGLAGLSLLKATIKTLPPNRRRRLIALSQAEWFEPRLAAETRLRLSRVPVGGEGSATIVTVKPVDHPDDPYLPILRATQEATAETVEATRAWIAVKTKRLDSLEEASDKSLRLQKRLIRNQHSMIESLDAMRRDQLTLCMLMKGILDEAAALRHIVLGLSMLVGPIASPSNSPQSPGAPPAVERLDESSNGRVSFDDYSRNARRNKKETA